MARLSAYLVPRIKLAFGRAVAVLLDLAFLRRDPDMKLVRIGTAYGGWYCCQSLLGPGRAAVCCGAGEDVSFDIGLNANWGMRIICVDPTPRAIRHVEALLAAGRQGQTIQIEAGPSNYDLKGFREADFSFVPRAVWSTDGVLELFAPRDPAHVSYSALNLQHTAERIQVRASTLASILREFSISQPALLKVDIEGAEGEVLGSMLGAGILPDQLLVEFDQLNQPLTPLFWVDLLRLIRNLRAVGYRLVHREHANYLFVLTRGARR